MGFACTGNGVYIVARDTLALLRFFPCFDETSAEVANFNKQEVNWIVFNYNGATKNHAIGLQGQPEHVEFIHDFIPFYLRRCIHLVTKTRLYLNERFLVNGIVIDEYDIITRRKLRTFYTYVSGQVFHVVSMHITQNILTCTMRGNMDVVIQTFLL